MASFPCKALEGQPVWHPDNLPAFPAVALKALNLIAGRDTSLLELCNLIRADAAFSSAILRVANSPLVAFSKNITSVMQASMLLGFQRLKSVVLAVGLKDYLKQPFTPLLQACWRHSVACAMIAEHAAQACRVDKDFAYTAGILHDIGRAAMAAAAPESFSHIAEIEANEPRDLLPRERELFGMDHCQAGAWLVKVWGLPMVFLEVTSYHHDKTPEMQPGARVVAASCTLADVLGFGVAPYLVPPSYRQVVSGFPEVARGGFPPEAETLAAEIASKIKVIESV